MKQSGSLSLTSSYPLPCWCLGIPSPSYLNLSYLILSCETKLWIRVTNEAHLARSPGPVSTSTKVSMCGVSLPCLAHLIIRIIFWCYQMTNSYSLPRRFQCLGCHCLPGLASSYLVHLIPSYLEDNTLLRRSYKDKWIPSGPLPNSYPLPRGWSPLHPGGAQYWSCAQNWSFLVFHHLTLSYLILYCLILSYSIPIHFPVADPLFTQVERNCAHCNIDLVFS